MQYSPLSKAEKDEILNSFFEKSNEGLVAINKNGIIRFANAGAENMLGYDKGELNNQTMAHIISTDHRQTLIRKMNSFFTDKTTQKIYNTNTVLVKKDKTKITIQVSISNHLHSKEGPLIMALFTDITEELNLKKKLKEEHDFYESVLEKMADAFINLDRNWQYTFINPAASNMFDNNLSTEEMIGKVLWKATPEINGTLFEAKLREVMKSRQLCVFETKSFSNEKWLEVSIYPHDGGIALFCRDITQHKIKNKNLSLSEERFSKTFYSNPGPLSLNFLGNGKFKDVNTRFLEVFGLKREDVIGKTPSEIGLPQYIKTYESKNIEGQKLKEKSIRNREVSFNKSTGETIQMLLSGEIIQLENQDFIFSTLVDITEKKNAQKASEKLNELLEQRVRVRTLELTKSLEREKALNDLKSRFVTMASHEFRTPLASLLTSTSILESYTNAYSDEKLLKHFNRIKSSVSNLTNILNDFISLEKIEKGKTEMKSSLFNLPETIANIIEEMHFRLKDGQKINHVHTGDVLLNQDVKKIHNTLFNLISNAIKYSNENKQIDVTSEIRKQRVTISVKDNGIGIPEKDQENLFTLFFRASNAHNAQGTGLGLCIIKNYVELMGGSLSFISKENEGSTFTVNLPVNAHYTEQSTF